MIFRKKKKKEKTKEAMLWWERSHATMLLRSTGNQVLSFRERFRGSGLGDKFPLCPQASQSVRALKKTTTTTKSTVTQGLDFAGLAHLDAKLPDSLEG